MPAKPPTSVTPGTTSGARSIASLPQDRTYSDTAHNPFVLTTLFHVSRPIVLAGAIRVSPILIENTNQNPLYFLRFSSLLSAFVTFNPYQKEEFRDVARNPHGSPLSSPLRRRMRLTEIPSDLARERFALTPRCLPDNRAAAEHASHWVKGRFVR